MYTLFPLQIDDLSSLRQDIQIDFSFINEPYSSESIYFEDSYFKIGKNFYFDLKLLNENIDGKMIDLVCKDLNIDFKKFLYYLINRDYFIYYLYKIKQYSFIALLQYLGFLGLCRDISGVKEGVMRSKNEFKQLTNKLERIKSFDIKKDDKNLLKYTEDYLQALLQHSSALILAYYLKDKYEVKFSGKSKGAPNLIINSKNVEIKFITNLFSESRFMNKIEHYVQAFEEQYQKKSRDILFIDILLNYPFIMPYRYKYPRTNEVNELDRKCILFFKPIARNTNINYIYYDEINRSNK